MWGVKLQALVDQTWGTSDPDFQAVTDVDTPADSAHHCNADVQALNVTLSRLELRTRLYLDTDQECIRYLTVGLTWLRDPYSDPRSVQLFQEAL